jgi:L-rhamnose mutarotase
VSPIVVLAVDLLTTFGHVAFQVSQIRRLLDLAGRSLYFLIHIVKLPACSSIAEYRRYHEKYGPRSRGASKNSGLVDMEIYLRETPPSMIMEVNEDFSFEAKAQADQDNPKVQEWKKLMDVAHHGVSSPFGLYSPTMPNRPARTDRESLCRRAF